MVPYISERLNHRITNIFRKGNIPVRIAHKSDMLRQALSHTSTERKCTRDKCIISSSVPAHVHDRVREHIYSFQNKDYKGIDVKIIMSENDPANLRLFEAFYIRKCKPTLNSREECTEFADLLF